MSGVVPATLEDIDWFHPNADRHIAESLLMQNGEEGSYLLRNSKSAGDYSLSVRGQDSVKHYTITANDGGYKFGLAKFANLTEFLEHFQSQPLLGGESGVVVLLKYPYPREVCEPVQYDSIKVHAQMGQVQMEPDRLRLSMGTKEGYLTKQGAIIKNWKLRWFVLNKNEIRYYAQRSSPEPIRTMDLGECQECIRSADAKQEYSFSLVFPWRTFNLRASTDADAHDWMQLINWKLEKLRSRSSRANVHI